jgi:hypothetical protein
LSRVGPPKDAVGFIWHGFGEEDAREVSELRREDFALSVNSTEAMVEAQLPIKEQIEWLQSRTVLTPAEVRGR